MPLNQTKYMMKGMKMIKNIYIYSYEVVLKI